MINSAQYFPQEIILKILFYMDLEDLLRCASVNKEWKIMAEDNFLWRNIVPNAPTPNDVDAKKYFQEHAVVSKEGIYASLLKFAQEVKAASAIGEFTLYCSSKPEYTMRTHLVWEKANPAYKKNMKEFCVYIKNIPKTGWMNGYGSIQMDLNYQDMNIQIVEMPIASDLFYDKDFFQRVVMRII